MPETMHQTVKLSRGKHSSPQRGACVMELASMLAGEPFSDRPDCVCPVLAGFLRVYNDQLDDDRRQDLFAYAARVVGSRAPASVAQARAARLVDWVLQPRYSGWRRIFVSRRIRSVSPASERGTALIGSLAADGIRKHTARSHAAVLALIDELLTIGQPDQPASVPVSSEHYVEAAFTVQPVTATAPA